MQRKLLLVIPVLWLLSGQVTAEIVIQQTETHSIFKGLFLSVWSKLRTLSPHESQNANSDIVYATGIRGAEATETLFQPYWKDDLSLDATFQQQLKKFSQAQQLMDNGELQASAKAFDEFIHNYQDSSLIPNALFAKSICNAGIGNKSEASATMKLFIDSNPNHPLISDAQKVIALL